VLGVIAMISCGRAAPPAEGKDVMRPPDPQATGDVVITAKVMAETPRKPPLVDVSLDLGLDNRAATARWVMIPPITGTPRTGGVDAMELRRWTGAGAPAIIATLLGRSGGLIVRLAPGAHLRWRGAVIGSWIERPISELEVISAETAAVGGKPLQAWFPDGEPQIAGDLTVDTAAIAGVVRFDPGYAELPLVLSGERTQHLTLAR